MKYNFVSLLLLLLISSCTLQEVDYQREDIATIKQKFEAVYDEDSNISLDVNWNDFREYQIGTEKVYEFSVSTNVTIESNTNARVQGEKETIMTLVAVDRVEQTLFALRHLSLYGEREYLDYNNLSEGFTGIETFYTLDLKFEQSRVVKNGLTVDWGKASRKESSGATNKTQGCFTVTRDIYTTTCIDGTNDCWTTYSHTETITFCEEGFDRGDSGGGGGISGGSGGGVGGGSGAGSSSGDLSEEYDDDLTFPVISWENSSISKRASHVINYLRFCNKRGINVSIKSIFDDFPTYGVMKSYSTTINFNGESTDIYIEIPISHNLTTFENTYGESKPNSDQSRWIFRYYKVCNGCSRPLAALDLHVPISFRDAFVDFLLGQ